MKKRGHVMERHAPTPSPYQRLPIVEKRAENIARVREPAVTCPACDTQVMPADLVIHLERCGGPREPGPSSRWVTWCEARAMGVAKWTLSYWARTSKVRFRGGRGDRQYLLRDLALQIAHQHAERRRQLQDLQPMGA